MAIGPAGPDTAPAGASAITDIAVLGLESLYESANSYECYQNPETASCKLGGIGDLFRYFASPQQKQQIQMLEALSQISNQLKNVEAKIDRVAATTSQVQFKQLTKDLDGGVIFQTL
jgi:hypothetical protein